MDELITTRDFLESHGDRLGLHWKAGKEGENAPLLDPESTSNFPIAGYLNLVKPNRVQVLGPDEIIYLEELGKNSHDDAIKRLFDSQPAMIIFADVTDVNKINNEFIHLATQNKIPLLYTSLPSPELIELLQYYLKIMLGQSEVLHGVFMEVMGLGVLLTGPSGIGKSELALELLSRGHRLIADDAPEFRRSAPDTIRGRCPPLLKDFLEVRGLGILNVRAMFGDTAILSTKRLRLIVHLDHIAENTPWELDRIGSQKNNRTILDVKIPEVHIPIAPGRNVAIIIEAAVRNHVLQLNGYNAASDFILRQKKIMDGE